jgi:predicted metal-dependent hydrolase
MSTADTNLTVSGIKVDVVYKDIKNLHLAVYPPHGRVRVAAPRRLDHAAVRLAVISRLGWIRSQQSRLIGQDRQGQREFVSGESHYFMGRRFRLRVRQIDGAAALRVSGSSSLELRIRPGADRDARERVVNEWYRQELRALVPQLLTKWEDRIGARASAVGIRRMRTRWGTCDPGTGRILLNLELAKKPPSSIEYVLVHELIHLHERQHNARFRELLEQAMPGWGTRRDELNQAPLGHMDWSY